MTSVYTGGKHVIGIGWALSQLFLNALAFVFKCPSIYMSTQRRNPPVRLSRKQNCSKDISVLNIINSKGKRLVVVSFEQTTRRSEAECSPQEAKHVPTLAEG